MAKRKYPIEVGGYYHIYNRGTEKRKIFINKGDLYYFFETIQISNMEENIKSSDRNLGRKDIKEKIKKNYNNKPLVEIISYALMPNHYHFVLKEIKEGGISKFMSKLTGSYSKYFNAKYDRSGTLFQGRFRSSPLSKYNSLERTTAYTNLNYKHHGYDPKKDLIKTSLFEYLGEEKGEKICSEKEIKDVLKGFKNLNDYKKYLKEISKIFIEEHDQNIEDLDFFELDIN